MTTLLTLFNTFQSLQEEEVDQELELLVLASDGLWDVVTNEVSSSTYCNVWLSGQKLSEHATWYDMMIKVSLR